MVRADSSPRYQQYRKPNQLLAIFSTKNVMKELFCPWGCDTHHRMLAYVAKCRYFDCSWGFILSRYWRLEELKSLDTQEKWRVRVINAYIMHSEAAMPDPVQFGPIIVPAEWKIDKVRSSWNCRNSLGAITWNLFELICEYRSIIMLTYEALINHEALDL